MRSPPVRPRGDPALIGPAELADLAGATAIFAWLTWITAPRSPTMTTTGYRLRSTDAVTSAPKRARTHFGDRHPGRAASRVPDLALAILYQVYILSMLVLRSRP
jgi:hypothetical protein